MFMDGQHIVRVLLKYGARSVARKNLEKMSALMLASQRGHAQVVWNLLQQERATVPFEDGCISIHQVADMSTREGGMAQPVILNRLLLATIGK